MHIRKWPLSGCAVGLSLALAAPAFAEPRTAAEALAGETATEIARMLAETGGSAPAKREAETGTVRSEMLDEMGEDLRAALESLENVR